MKKINFLLLGILLLGFSARGQVTSTATAPPTLSTPEDGKKFTLQELTRPVQFRWTPLVPKPKEPVTYRLKVWQLMEGQNGTQAMRNNTPIITKDVDNLAQVTVNGIETGPCKPPYLCDFIWNVQALNQSGNPMGNNNGNSEPFHFSVITENTQCPSNVFPENKKVITLAGANKEIIFKWKPSQGAAKYRLKVWQLMQGQNGTQAMRSNDPLFKKEIDGGQADALTDGLLIIRYLYTGPCKPPYLCDFVWNLEVMNAAGQNSCTSGPFHFSVVIKDL